MTIALRRRIGWLAIGQGTARAAQLLVALVLVHLMPTAEWNSLAIVLTVYLVAVTVGSLNLEHSVVTFLPLLDAGQHHAFLVQTRRFLLFTGALAAGTILVAVHVTGFIDGTATTALLCIAVVLEIPAVIAGPTLVARESHRAAGIWDSTFGILFFACAAIPAAARHDARSVVEGLAFYGLCRFIALAFVVRAHGRSQTARRVDNLVRRQIAFCAPLGLSLALGTLTRAVDKWIVAWLIPGAIGSYAIAAQEIPLVAVLPYAGGAAVAAGLVRHFSDGNSGAALDLWRRQASAMCAPVVAISVGVGLVSGELFDILLPPHQRAAAGAFRFFAIIGVHRVTEYGMVLRAAHRNAHIVESAAVVLIGCVVFGVVGGWTAGIIGVSLGTALAFGIGWLVMLRRIAQAFDSTIARVFPWNRWLRSVLAACTGFVGGTTAAAPFDGVIVRLLLKVVVFVTVFRLLDGAAHDDLDDTDRTYKGTAP